ncbi:MAG: hypothetical protein KF764_06605 [Labilithrix sp.]|nr:hypothetical protein [Labilithrix sp.]
MVERLFAPWPDIARARAVLGARKKKRTPNAARDLDELDEAVTAFVEDARIWKQLVSMHNRFARAHELHGQQVAVQLFLEEMRATEQAVPAVLRGRSKLPVPARFADDVRAAAKKHGQHDHAFQNAIHRAFFKTRRDEVERLARTLDRDEAVVIDALTDDAVQTALAGDAGLAAQRALAVLRIVKPRTMHRRLATSRANANPR